MRLPGFRCVAAPFAIADDRRWKRSGDIRYGHGSDGVVGRMRGGIPRIETDIVVNAWMLVW